MRVLDRIREGFLFTYPRNRREVAYRRGTETFLHAFTKYGWAVTVTLLFFYWAGLINPVAVFKALLGFNVLVILGFVAGAIVQGVLSGGAAFRHWAANPDPMKEEAKPRGRPPKKPV